MEENRFNILIEKLVNEKIPDKIDIDSINNLFEIIENNKPIPIEYYTKNLVELSKYNTIDIIIPLIISDIWS